MNGSGSVEFEPWYRREYPRVLATIVLVVGDGDLGRDAADEAFARALTRTRAARESPALSFRPICENGCMPVTVDQIRSVPKVLLHDHLDGGLRSETIVELAAETGYDALPTTDVAELGRWMAGVAQRGRLELYLEAFQHTVGVMQTRDALIRVTPRCGSRRSCT